MTEYISREVAMNELRDFIHELDRVNASAESNAVNEALTRIRRLPTADVHPVVHGEWLPVDEKNDAFDCSNCEAMVQRCYNFCPVCGADMTMPMPQPLKEET